jgi:hypothetical protein
MNRIPEDIEDLSPYTLLRNFSRNRVLPCLFLALVIHVLVIGGLSANYIYRTWIDPTARLPQPEAAVEEEAAAGTEGTDPAEEGGLAEDAGEAPPDAPVVDRVTGKADPEELPEEPGGLGISIDDIKE